MVTPKTKESRRKIVVDTIVLGALKEHKEKKDKIKQQLGDAYHDKQFEFAKTERQPRYPIVLKLVQIKMALLLRLANLNTELTPHSQQHTHTSLLADASVVLEQIMN